MLVTFFEINGEMHFHLLGTNHFTVRAKNERFYAAGSHCNCRRRTSTAKILRLGQKLHQKAHA